MTAPIYDFSDRVAIVTGGASGIGAATAMRFARSGASVVVADIDMPGAERLVDTILAEGGSAAPFRCDVSDESDVEHMVRFTVETFGGLDHAFNNAGILGSDRQPTGLFATETWTHTVAINLTGVFNCMKHELAHMASHGGGTIVNTSSTAGLKAAQAGADDGQCDFFLAAQALPITGGCESPVRGSKWMVTRPVQRTPSSPTTMAVLCTLPARHARHGRRRRDSLRRPHQPVDHVGRRPPPPKTPKARKRWFPGPFCSGGGRI